MPKLCQPWDTQSNIASKFRIEKAELVIVHLSEKWASAYQYSKSLIVLGVYLSESLAPTYPTTIHKNITYLLIFLHKLWSRAFLEKLTSLQLVKKFAAFYGIRGFITTFTSAHQLSLSWASSIQSIPSHHTSRRSILILSSNLRLVLPSDLFPSDFSTNILYTTLPNLIRATCHDHLILQDFITYKLLGEEYK